MGLSKWLINLHTGIFQFYLNLFTLQNKFSLGEMGQIDKPCVTDNCSVIPTESVTWGRFSCTGETCAVTQETTIIFFFKIQKYSEPCLFSQWLLQHPCLLIQHLGNTCLYTVRNQHKAGNTQKIGLGHHTRRFPAVPWKKWGRDSDTLECLDVFLGVETAPHKD